MTNHKTYRIYSIETINQLSEISDKFNIKSENHIVNEALRFGLPILKKHLETPGGIKPSEDPKFDEILNELTTLKKRLADTLNELENIKEKQLVSIAVQQVSESIISSVYSRIKKFIAEQPYASSLSEAEEKAMDTRLPSQFKIRKEQLLDEALSDIEEEDDDK